jgi:amino acid permease
MIKTMIPIKMGKIVEIILKPKIILYTFRKPNMKPEFIFLYKKYKTTFFDNNFLIIFFGIELVNDFWY